MRDQRCINMAGHERQAHGGQDEVDHDRYIRIWAVWRRVIICKALARRGVSDSSNEQHGSVST